MQLQSNVHIIDLLKQIKDQELSIAVAVEGGGLRGVVSAGLLKVLDDFGLASNIKAISGTSSGAINAAYFLNNNMEDCFNLYRAMSSRDFIQPLRWPEAMNLDFLFEEKMKTYPLDFLSIKNQERPFFVSVTECESGKGTYLLANTHKNIHTLLRASTSAPLFTRNKERMNGQLYNDGHIELAIPFDAFDPQKYDYILCLLTQPKNYLKKKTPLGRFLEKAALYKYSRSYKNSYALATEKYNLRLEHIYKSKKLVPIAIDTNTFIVSKTTTDPTEINRCIEGVGALFAPH